MSQFKDSSICSSTYIPRLSAQGGRLGEKEKTFPGVEQFALHFGQEVMKLERGKAQGVKSQINMVTDVL